ncbi:ski oncogene-like isoform X2 [Euwallacea fornicatus]|uniref:ski oncogene-like isoform X2 n=1 Tax=Euwallacea fornicatus TaxID=995702 RepID=UPI00338E3EBC
MINARIEVNSHLKTVLRTYQYSATKSLQGPGHSLNHTVIKNEASSPETSYDEEFQPVSVPFPVHQVPILAAPDTSSSDRIETILEGQAISCFDIGGEKRLCLPQVLTSVLRDFNLPEINRECDELQIYCSRCTFEQLNILKTLGILPCNVINCGLITKSDAERLCSALLYSSTKNVPFRPRKGMTSFPVYHECFGETHGRCYPDLYTSKQAKCIECVDCQCGFSPQQFVCHVHRMESRTIHWGFDSNSHWRSYLHLPDDQADQEGLKKILDELRDRYEGKVPFPPSPEGESSVKRKQVCSSFTTANGRIIAPPVEHLIEAISTSDIVKDHQAVVSKISDLPPKKQKIDMDYLGTLGRVHPFPLPAAAAALMQQQIYALEPVYIHRYLQEFNNGRHSSAFKPVTQSIKEQKLRSANALGLAARCAADPPLLQNPEKVVLMSESERFERSYQPNVALVPPSPTKHRYGKDYEPGSNHATTPPQCSSTSVEKEEILSPVKTEPLDQHSPLTNGHGVKEEIDCIKTPSSPPLGKVSVLQKNNSTGTVSPKYNSEIELSTDTEDSASESSEKNNSDYLKLEEVLKSANDDVREKVLELFRNLSKERERAVLECRAKEQARISELEIRNAELKRQNAELQKELDDLKVRAENNNQPIIRNNIIKDSSTEVTSSSIIIHAQEKESPSPPLVQKSVIASVASVTNSAPNSGEPEVVKSTEPE